MVFSRPSVVIDNGSYSCKAGFSCDNHPVSMVRTFVGRPKDRLGFYGKIPYEVYVGDEALFQTDYELHSPIERGRIVHWDNMERIWHHIYYREIKVAPEERAVILACSPRTDIEEKIKCCEIFFETLNAPALCVQPQSVLSLYGSGYTTGITVDLGHAVSDINPVYEGGQIDYAHVETYLSGFEITEYITAQFLKKGVILDGYDPNFIEDFKRNNLRVASDNTQNCDRLSYHLPSGELINVSKEIYEATEMLFNPQLVLGDDTQCIALHEGVNKAASKCDSELLSDLYSAVVICGGLSAIPDLGKRLLNELQLCTKHSVNVIESSEAHCVAWLGAAIFAGLEDAKKVWVHKNQFEEYGGKIVKNKFFN